MAIQSRQSANRDDKNFKDDPVGRRIKTAAEVAQLTEYPVFCLAAHPSPDARFRTLFAGKDATPVKLFNNPSAAEGWFSVEHDGS
jgi:hypothetical protein